MDSSSRPKCDGYLRHGIYLDLMLSHKGQLRADLDELASRINQLSSHLDTVRSRLDKLIAEMDSTCGNTPMPHENQDSRSKSVLRN